MYSVIANIWGKLFSKLLALLFNLCLLNEFLCVLLNKGCK
jgi:hypothetical protein